MDNVTHSLAGLLLACDTAALVGWGGAGVSRDRRKSATSRSMG
jgi:hypothetical protein